MFVIKTGARRRLVALVAVVTLASLMAACGGRSVALRGDDAGQDAAMVDVHLGLDAGEVDAVIQQDSDVFLDAGPDECACDITAPDDRPVELFHACTPPLRAGCTATVCEPGVTDCGEGYTCEDCGAAACCICAACLPACLFTQPTQGPLPEYLKLGTTYGTAGQEQDITINGFPFYVGALFYLARVGDSGELMQMGGGTCSFTVHAPARGPGMVPVWVSEYGGGEPWVLAGFYTYSYGDLTSCVQPGYWCHEGDTCCSTPEVPMSCQGGRCRRD